MYSTIYNGKINIFSFKRILQSYSRFSSKRYLGFNKQRSQLLEILQVVKSFELTGINLFRINEQVVHINKQL